MITDSPSSDQPVKTVRFLKSIPREFGHRTRQFFLQLIFPGVTPRLSPYMDSQKDESSDLVKNSVLYREFLAEREEVLRHKWIESEKTGQDIGFEKALLDWVIRHRSTWREGRKKQPATT